MNYHVDTIPLMTGSLEIRWAIEPTNWFAKLFWRFIVCCIIVDYARLTEGKTEIEEE